MDPEPCDRQPAQDIPVQDQPRGGNDERRERLPAAEQPQARAPTPPAPGRTRDNDRLANEGANVDANLPGGCSEASTSEERRVHQQLKALLEAAAA
jgi:hypothetical protein